MRRTVTFVRLTLFNTARLLRGPFLLPGSVLFLAYFLWASSYPGQSVDSWYADMSTSSLFIAAIGFGAVTPSAVREARHPVISATPLGRTGRITALALAAVLLLWVLLAGLGAWVWLTAEPLPPAGIITPFALPVPFLVAAAGPLGALLLVLWTRSYLPLIILALCLPLYLVYNGILLSERLNSAMSRATMALQQAISPFPDYSVSLTGVNLYSLAYTSLVVAALVALVLGARRPVRVLVATSAAAALLAAGALGVALHGNSTVWRDGMADLREHADDQVYGVDGPWPCQEVEGVTYCPLPGYDSWVPSWHETMEPVLDELPEAARADAPVVWQDANWYTREFDVSRPAVTVHDYLAPDSHPWHSYLYSAFARKTLGMYAGTPDPYGLDDCRGTGQARTVVVAWVVDRVVASYHPDDLYLRTDMMATALTDLAPSPADLALGRQVVSVPPERMHALLEEHWERISSGEMGTLELAALLEVPVTGEQDRIADPAEWSAAFSEMGANLYEAWNPYAELCPVRT